MAVSVFSKRELAYKRLVRLILSGAMDEVEPLSERKLSQALKIGRTPVREALHQLAAEGLVQVKPARGSFIRRLSKRELQEIFELRQALEGMAAYLAAKRGPTKKLLAFSEEFQRISSDWSSFDAGKVDDIGAAFHIEVVNAARNQILKENYEPLRRRSVLAFGLPRYSNTNWVQRSVREHREILKAISEQEPERAERLMREHIANALEVSVRVFEKLDKGTSELVDADGV